MMKNRVRLRNIRCLKELFTSFDLIQYTKTNDFNSLNDKVKSLMNLLIREILLEEHKEKVPMSQNSEGLKRGEVPPVITSQEQLHAQILQIIFSGRKIRSKTFKFLKDPFTFDLLIQYTKSDHFDLLDKKVKTVINSIIYDALKREFNRKILNLSQDLEEYVKRDLIPELPVGYNSFAEYEEQCTAFDSLARKQKARVRTLAAFEKKSNSQNQIKVVNTNFLVLNGKEYKFIG